MRSHKKVDDVSRIEWNFRSVIGARLQERIDFNFARLCRMCLKFEAKKNVRYKFNKQFIIMAVRLQQLHDALMHSSAYDDGTQEANSGTVWDS